MTLRSLSDTRAHGALSLLMLSSVEKALTVRLAPRDADCFSALKIVC
jgi:hypothetical protein